jgi:predicted methyltransferase MtxX (methanogen marker protein 4)
MYDPKCNHILLLQFQNTIIDRIRLDLFYCSADYVASSGISGEITFQCISILGVQRKDAFTICVSSN